MQVWTIKFGAGTDYLFWCGYRFLILVWECVIISGVGYCYWCVVLGGLVWVQITNFTVGVDFYFCVFVCELSLFLLCIFALIIFCVEDFCAWIFVLSTYSSTTLHSFSYFWISEYLWIYHTNNNGCISKQIVYSGWNRIENLIPISTWFSFVPIVKATMTNIISVLTG